MWKPAARAADPAIRLPASLRTRAGWSRFFDLRRTREPHLHQIEPTNHCVYSCVMCPRRTMTRPIGFMDMDVFTRVMDEVAGYAEPVRSREIELFHFGESLFHPGLPRMIAMATERRLNTVLSVNGPQLTAPRAAAILDAVPTKVIISLDGGGQESYAAARGQGADYGVAHHNIRHFIDERNRRRSATRIVLRMILMKQNEALAPAFEEEWKRRGVDIELREFFPWGQREFAALGDYRRYPAGMPCPFPWQYLVVQWNGDVVPCCRDCNGVHVMGNVADMTLAEIWNGDRFEAFRDRHRTGNYGTGDICEECMNLYWTAEEGG